MMAKNSYENFSQRLCTSHQLWPFSACLWKQPCTTSAEKCWHMKYLQSHNQAQHWKTPITRQKPQCQQPPARGWCTPCHGRGRFQWKFWMDNGSTPEAASAATLLTILEIVWNLLRLGTSETTWWTSMKYLTRRDHDHNISLDSSCIYIFKKNETWKSTSQQLFTSSTSLSSGSWKSFLDKWVNSSCIEMYRNSKRFCSSFFNKNTACF